MCPCPSHWSQGAQFAGAGACPGGGSLAQPFRSPMGHKQLRAWLVPEGHQGEGSCPRYPAAPRALHSLSAQIFALFMLLEILSQSPMSAACWDYAVYSPEPALASLQTLSGRPCEHSQMPARPEAGPGESNRKKFPNASLASITGIVWLQMGAGARGGCEEEGLPLNNTCIPIALGKWYYERRLYPEFLRVCESTGPVAHTPRTGTEGNA